MERIGDKSKKTRLRVLLPVLAAVLLFAGCFAYLETYYRAQPLAVAAVEAPSVSETVLESGDVAFAPENAVAGLIFYPGGKVEETAYVPLMRAIAEKGVFCVLCKMPFRLAVLELHAADDVREAYANVSRWYIGGHSLGGVMAATELSAHPGTYDGLVLLGSYSTEDFSGADVRVLSLYGSEDHVLNREKYERKKAMISENLLEIEIPGGCHAGFGCYGAQRGDGIPTISNTEQIRITAELIYEWIGAEIVPNAP